MSLFAGVVSAFVDNVATVLMIAPVGLAIAKKLNITVGSLTTAVNSLVKKGYVDRFRSKEDRRVVYVRLLEKGENAYHHHEDYHKQMTQAIVDKLDKSEIPVLLKTLDALTGFFTDYTRESKEKSSDSMDKE